MATGAVVLRLARRRSAVVAQTLHRCGASLFPPLSPSRFVEQPLLSTSRLRSLPFTSDAPEEYMTDGFHGPPEHQGMKKVDWVCPRCKFMNFARNVQCLRCKAGVPRDGYVQVQMREGDWNCPGCGFMNFGRNTRCLRCQVNRPGRMGMPLDSSYNGGDRPVGTFHGSRLNGFESLDWDCPKCQYRNFARNSKCPICREPRPSMELQGGDWECPSCKFPNFRRNTSCPKCNHSRPSDLPEKQGDGLVNLAEKIGDDSDEASCTSLLDAIENIKKGKDEEGTDEPQL